MAVGCLVVLLAATSTSAPAELSKKTRIVEKQSQGELELFSELFLYDLREMRKGIVFFFSFCLFVILMILIMWPMQGLRCTGRVQQRLLPRPSLSNRRTGRKEATATASRLVVAEAEATASHNNKWQVLVAEATRVPLLAEADTASSNSSSNNMEVEEEEEVTECRSQ